MPKLFGLWGFWPVDFSVNPDTYFRFNPAVGRQVNYIVETSGRLLQILHCQQVGGFTGPIVFADMIPDLFSHLRFCIDYLERIAFLGNNPNNFLQCHANRPV